MPVSSCSETIANCRRAWHATIMRFALLLLVFLAASPAHGQYWDYYENARFGYGIDVPPGYSGSGESDNGDGQMFYDLPAEQGLTVWGGQLTDSLQAEAMLVAETFASQRWTITESASTPQWSMLVAKRDHRVLMQRSILLCDGASYAAFRAEFNIRDQNAMSGVLQGVTRSFVPIGC
jgi:hypothetical protein